MAKILVIGDLMIDHYLWGSANRVSPEAPVLIVDIEKETTVLGGAGNVVNNLTSLGCEVSVLSVIGKDLVGIELKEMLKSIKVNSYLIEEEERKTSKKSRVIASHSHVLRYDRESKKSITPKSSEALYRKFQAICEVYDIILLSDYDKGVLTKWLTQKIITYANQKNKKVIVDPKGDDYTKYHGAYLLTPNKKEAIEASKIDIKDEKTLIKALKRLQEIANLSVSLITLSEDGIAIFEDRLIIRSTVAREVYDVTGAGDTVLASLGYALANGKDILSAIEFANLSAGVVVGKLGSATVTIAEIDSYNTRNRKSSFQKLANKIKGN